ncbi:ankyrin repeat protein [Cooperia oncophora]
MTAIDLETYPLHKAAFFNDVHSISQLIKAGRSLYEQDMHGNTALHISTMLGHREATALLLAHNAPVKVKNCDGWNPLMEAVSYGDRQIITEMLRKLKAQSRMGMTSRKAHLIKMLEDIGDFYLELKWDFQSWIPLLSRMLPSDVCQIYKKGTQLRMDTTLADFNERRWERGDISFVFNAKAKYESDELIIMDNNAKVFQRVRHEESEAEVDEEVDVLMSSDIVSAQEQIGDYNVNFYLVEGMRLVSRKRREHLTADDIKKNKSFMQSLASGAAVGDEDFKSLQHRKSLAPPGRMPTTWEEYVGAAPGAAPPLGRAQILKQNEKQFTRFLLEWSEDFPMGIDVLLDILEIVAPFKHLDKLRRFCEARLPPGFPVRVEIPLLPTISAKGHFSKSSNLWD